ncbi:uncharacterized protein N7443_010204 [Penicillium atrosanguineum]|uniref:uncharacterized protein n=1 Tax=Penicillium atrosanguineum TaxID=1132637 RepID=UPI0023A0C2A5|nr:uncharacterized protein N7443_010204 [Penicillium atrosanguineum]KAJ5137503.1 hypothetical protein N7526_003736 [Penicillium atrosanguineum]KAJ5289951.1 hypothetical protein N7443_010204 [Penicillium atrosanguineum]
MDGPMRVRYQVLCAIVDHGVELNRTFCTKLLILAYPSDPLLPEYHCGPAFSSLRFGSPACFSTKHYLAITHHFFGRYRNSRAPYHLLLSLPLAHLVPAKVSYFRSLYCNIGLEVALGLLRFVLA